MRTVLKRPAVYVQDGQDGHDILELYGGHYNACIRLPRINAILEGDKLLRATGVFVTTITLAHYNGHY